jgi:hypothetical protein
MPAQQDAHIIHHLAHGATLIHFESRDPARNRARCYVLHRTTTLDGAPAIQCMWGRSGQPLRVRAVVSTTPESVEGLLAHLIRRRLRHGYAIVIWE